jgi:hypothetical protein
MSILVVYESMWGNTRAVAEAVARGMGSDADVHLVEVSDAPDQLPDDVRMLVVGGPTHAFSMTRETTRADAVRQGAAAEHAGRGIREWLDALPAEDGLDVATFDTRITKVRRLPGSAARAAGKQVRRHHVGRLVDTESFYVDDTDGPLHAGELDRAEAWGTTLRDHVVRRGGRV